MMLRRKPFLTYFIFCAIPLLLLAALGYWRGIRAVDAVVAGVVQRDLKAFNASVDDILHEKESKILRLSIKPEVRRVVIEKTGIDASGLNFLTEFDKHFHSFTLFDRDRQPLCYRTKDSEWNSWDSSSTHPADLPQPDPHVWELHGNGLLERPGNSNTATFEYAAPIQDEKGTTNIGALVGVVDLEAVFRDAAAGLESRGVRGTSDGSMILVVDRSRKFVYHSNAALKLQQPADVLPGFAFIANAMTTNDGNLGQFRSTGGSSYLAVYSPIPRLNVGVVIARSRSEFTLPVHLWGLTGVALALLTAAIAAFVLERHVQGRSKGIARVKEDLSAIAKGELDRRIILQSSDDARGLADNINVVTERLRAQIAREEESRQFESFVRLSAMLTHDLKNAIEGLSLTVANMERHFDNPQFRSDALKGLTSATDKLKALVARLARPLTTLSGEHKRPTNVDLIPILQRVIAMTAEPLRGKHKIVLRLPTSLFALADAARVEEVIENLVLNALEAMADRGGTLTIEAGQSASGAPMFAISDTGRGMSRTFIDTRLFRPFSTTKRTGIGLGLYTCREVIKASAGSIEVDSIEGAGTTFRVVLPSIPHDRRN